VKELEQMIRQPRALGAATVDPSAANPALLMGEVRQIFMDESEGASRVLKGWLREANANTSNGPSKESP